MSKPDYIKIWRDIAGNHLALAGSPEDLLPAFAAAVLQANAQGWRNAVKGLLEGLDTHWSTLPEGRAAISAANALLNGQTEAETSEAASVAGLPMQPIHIATDGCVRFVTNPLVRHLLDHGGLTMNDLVLVDATDAERSQFAQLIGYTVSDWGGLSYAEGTPAVPIADAIAEKLLQSAAPETGAPASPAGGELVALLEQIALIAHDGQHEEDFDAITRRANMAATLATDALAKLAELRADNKRLQDTAFETAVENGTRFGLLESQVAELTQRNQILAAALTDEQEDRKREVEQLTAALKAIVADETPYGNLAASMAATARAALAAAKGGA